MIGQFFVVVRIRFSVPTKDGEPTQITDLSCFFCMRRIVFLSWKDIETLYLLHLLRCSRRKLCTINTLLC
ncbi:hypothetical protein J4Q44_G00091820, partial [Coregonus suidteri]